MNYRECSGNLFHSSATFKVCTVNLTGAMGAGIAKQFRDRDPGLYYHYKLLCRKRKFKVGQIALYDSDAVPYKAILLPTKRFWKDPSRLIDVEASIMALAAFIKHHGHITIAMTPPGCGLGGLDYRREVEPLIKKHLNGLDCIIEMYGLND